MPVNPLLNKARGEELSPAELERILDVLLPITKDLLGETRFFPVGHPAASGQPAGKSLRLGETGLSVPEKT